MWLYRWFAACFFILRPPVTAKRPETGHPGRILDPRCGAVFTGGRAQSDHPPLSSTKIEPLHCPPNPVCHALSGGQKRGGMRPEVPAPHDWPTGGRHRVPSSRWGWDAAGAAGGPQTASNGPTRRKQLEGRSADAERPSVLPCLPATSSDPWAGQALPPAPSWQAPARGYGRAPPPRRSHSPPGAGSFG